MKADKITFAFFFLFSGVSQATRPGTILNNMKAEYKNVPLHNSTEQEYIEESYSPNYYSYKGDYCIKASDFKITNMAMKLVYRFVDKKEADTWISQYDCQFHVVRIDYEVKCSNSLRYQGTEYLLSKSKIENNAYPGGEKRGKRMASEQYDWIDGLPPAEYINADGSITLDARHNKIWGQYTIAKLDTNSILKKWGDGQSESSQRISNPEYAFTGTPGKLPRPVLFVHGLNSDYSEWGVEPLHSRNDIEGKVKKYENGSLPDMLARSNNLYNKEKDSIVDGKIIYSINSNGIYFFQAEKNSLPHWDKDKSQSKALYEKIKFVMNDFYKEQEKKGMKWSDINEHKIDLVGHSQGGLVIREMLRGLRDNPGDITEKGTANAANHINRIITVNTPHLGSALSAPSGDSIRNDYEGLALIIDNLNDRQKHKLLTVDVDLNNPALSTIASGATGLAGGFYDGYSLVYDNFDTSQLQGEDRIEEEFFKSIVCIFTGILGAIPSMIYGTDASVVMRGPYLGPYDFDIKLEQLFSDKTFSSVMEMDLLKEQRNKLNSIREDGKHLYKGNAFMERLNNGNSYPLLPNGSKAVLLPMYSDSSHKILQEIFHSLYIDASRLCAKQNDAAESCFAVSSTFSRLDEYINEYLKDVSKYLDDLLSFKGKFSDNLWKALVDIQETWLKGSDGLVETSSQKFIRGDNSPYNDNLKGYFLEPRPYAIHDAMAPWEAVLHGKAFNNKGAVQQGFDLLCALSPACDNAFALARQGDRNAVLKLSEAVSTGKFSERFLDVSGDFDLAPIYISEGVQALSVSANGEILLSARYEPGIGSSAALPGQAELMLGPEIATQPSVSRKGDSVSVSFMNYSGKVLRKDYFMPGLSNNLMVKVIAESNAEMSSVIIGSAVASNPETQKPPTPPPGHPLAPITLAVLHREAREEHESNTSRPRFLVYNATKDTLEFSKIAYYFTADPARIPNALVDYPNTPVSIENLGGDKWRFVLDAGNQKVMPRSFYPSADGWQTRVHYSDWHEYGHLDDWSADYSVGFAKFNSKIVIYDKNGKIIWGNEPPPEEESEEMVQKPEVTVAWKDDAPWEANTFKPRVTVKNAGDVPISDYHAQLWFRVPLGKSLAIPSPDAWYTPESQASAENAGGNVWRLDMHFDKHILYPGESVSEANIGLHLTDWSAFDKTVCGIALKDKDGSILFGGEPGIEECESREQNILPPALYSRRLK